MARCEDCLQYGIKILCENDELGPDERTAHIGRNSSMVLPGNIAHCQTKPLLPVIAESIRDAQIVNSDCGLCIHRFVGTYRD